MANVKDDNIFREAKVSDLKSGKVQKMKAIEMLRRTQNSNS